MTGVLIERGKFGPRATRGEPHENMNVEAQACTRKPRKAKDGQQATRSRRETWNRFSLPAPGSRTSGLQSRDTIQFCS